LCSFIAHAQTQSSFEGCGVPYDGGTAHKTKQVVVHLIFACYFTYIFTESRGNVVYVTHIKISSSQASVTS
jgi:hypothetical protein